MHYALWPFIGLLFLIAFVWILVYVSTLIAHRRRSKAADQRNFASYYVTQDSTIAGGYEISNTVSQVNVWHCQSFQSNTCLNNDKNELTLDTSWQRVNNFIMQYVFSFSVIIFFFRSFSMNIMRNKMKINKQISIHVNIDFILNLFPWDIYFIINRFVW